MEVLPLARSIVAAAALSVLGGCIAYPSLHGVPAEHGTELPERLLGSWRHEQDEELLEIVVSGTLDDGYEAHLRRRIPTEIDNSATSGENSGSFSRLASL